MKQQRWQKTPFWCAIILAAAIALTGCGAASEHPEPSGDSAAGQQSSPDTTADAASETTSGSQSPSEPASEPESASEPEPEPEKPPEVKLLMVGDMLLHDRIEKYALQEDRTYQFDAIFTHVAEEIKQADLAIANQEVIIGGEELKISGYPRFNAPYAFGDALVSAGFDMVCHATNHAVDKNKQGLVNCMNFWKTHYPDMAVLGIHDSKASQDEIYIYEQDGIRIAVLNYTYGTNGIALPEDMPYAVDLLDEKRVAAELDRAEELADFTVVCPHWGSEYKLQPTKTQKKWTELFFSHGADLVIGTHPHVIEPMEWIRDEATGREMLVYYSIGNFVNWTSGTGEGVANRMVGGMAEVTLTKDEDGKVVISDYGVKPLVSHVESRTNGVTVYFLSEYTKELEEKNEIRKQDGNFSLEYCRELCRQIWGGEEEHER